MTGSLSGDSLDFEYAANSGTEFQSQPTLKKLLEQVTKTTFNYTFSDLPADAKVLATTIKMKKPVAFLFNIAKGKLLAFPNIAFGGITSTSEHVLDFL